MRNTLSRILLISMILTEFLAGQTTQKTITRAADLPVFTYPVQGSIEYLLKNDEAFSAFAVQARKNIESVLAGYEITDTAAKRQLLQSLAAIDLLEGKDADALRRLEEMKALENTPAQKLMSGLTERAILRARRTSRDRNSPEYRLAVSRAIRQALDQMPYEVVETEVKTLRMRTQMASEAMILGQLRQFDPVVKKTGSLSSTFAHNLPWPRLMLTEFVPAKEPVLEVLADYLAAHKKEKPDIWTARSVALEPGRKYSSVTVAVWDSGVDLAVFRDQVARDHGKPAVLSYDLEGYKTTGELYPLTQEQKKRLPDFYQRLQGFSAMVANLDTPPAAALKKELSQLTAEQLRPFQEDLRLVTNYSHGTHVAGILLAGNPYARLVVGRNTFNHKMIPDPCPSRSRVERAAKSAQDFVSFFKRQGVRVVNMSWLASVGMLESGLELCALGGSAEERKKTAREWFEIGREGLEKAIGSAPEILFVAAAGNAANDATFNEFIPSSLRLPNLITAGAVDQAGDQAPFTSYGPTVVAHSNGYQVESYIPGGTKLKFSGTSMAAPNVANLAAKILAVNPKLTPPRVIEIIRTTADRTADGRRFLINPKRAIAAAQD